MGKIAESLILSLHRGKWNGEDLILDKNRVDSFGEVLTPSNIVSDMLDMVSSEYQCSSGEVDGTLPIDKTFLEPSCGTGNFLVQILERKLRLCMSKEDIFKAVSTIYGVDIQKDNVLESRLRMLEIVESKCDDEEFLTLIADVLEKNIIGGDMINDKYGCMLEGSWVGGYVSNKSGCVEPNDISKAHGRLIVYSWDWNNGRPISSAEFLVEQEDKEVVSIETRSGEELRNKFKSFFNNGVNL